ncbi:DNA methyltransferase [Kolteria novifilia]|uniref:DNA methyltransferase n=1 Tax=Kolteria novifilia TaxID=2527975 RepID=UPI003AF3F0D4
MNAQEATRLEIPRNTLIQGDCVQTLRALPAGCVDLVFADPPFNIGYEYDEYDDRKGRREYLAWSKDWIAGVYRALKDNGTFWLAIGDEYAAELKLIAQEDVGFHCRSWVIWYYTFGVNCVRGFSRSHTHLFHFVKDPEDFTFNAEHPDVRVPSARQLVYADNRANPKGRLPDNTWILRPQDAPPGGFAPRHDTWYYARVAGTFKEREGFHGCQMPEQLLGRIIRVSSNPTELVLDPFGGSGTTLAVAKKLGRQWIGSELSKEYATRIVERLAKTKPGDPLDGPEDPIASAPTTKSGRAKPQKVFVDEPTERAIIEAYQETCDGKSTDFLLCDPALNKKFVAACRGRGLRGAAVVWNRLLLRIRKSGKLPKANNKIRRLTFADMDRYSFASEIAMHIICTEYDTTLDEILCNPSLAADFDKWAKSIFPGKTPFEYRWAALAIRKRSQRSREFANEGFKTVTSRRLSQPIDLNNIDSVPPIPGVYIVTSDSECIYVGETLDIQRRVRSIVDQPFWERHSPKSLSYVPEEKFRDIGPMHGLQASFAQKRNSKLNSTLLRNDVMRSRTSS